MKVAIGKRTWVVFQADAFDSEFTLIPPDMEGWHPEAHCFYRATLNRTPKGWKLTRSQDENGRTTHHPNQSVVFTQP